MAFVQAPRFTDLDVFEAIRENLSPENIRTRLQFFGYLNRRYNENTRLLPLAKTVFEQLLRDDFPVIGVDFKGSKNGNIDAVTRYFILAPENFDADKFKRAFYDETQLDEKYFIFEEFKMSEVLSINLLSGAMWSVQNPNAEKDDLHKITYINQMKDSLRVITLGYRYMVRVGSNSVTREPLYAEKHDFGIPTSKEELENELALNPDSVLPWILGLKGAERRTNPKNPNEPEENKKLIRKEYYVLENVIWGCVLTYYQLHSNRIDFNTLAYKAPDQSHQKIGLSKEGNGKYKIAIPVLRITPTGDPLPELHALPSVSQSINSMYEYISQSIPHTPLLPRPGPVPLMPASMTAPPPLGKAALDFAARCAAEPLKDIRMAANQLGVPYTNETSQFDLCNAVVQAYERRRATAQ